MACWKGPWLLCLLLLHACVGSRAAVHLRTGALDVADPWSSPARRQLLAADEPETCQDARWGPLCGRRQWLMQVPPGTGSGASSAVLQQLEAHGALFSEFVPDDAWLVLAAPGFPETQAAQGRALLPFAAEHKIAPEWQLLLDAAQQATEEAATAHQKQQQQPEQQQQQQTDINDQLSNTEGAVEKRAHEALLAHPIARQLRTVVRTPAGPQGPGRALKGAAGSEEEPRMLIGVRFPTVWADDLQRVLPVGGRFAPAEAAAADWAAPLAALATPGGAAAGCVPAAHAEGETSLTVTACAHDLPAVVNWLAVQPQAHWLEPRRQMQLHNRVASAITSGAMRGDPGDDPASPATHPFWSAGVGLRGEGQVVGVGDSGLDLDSCYFYDPAVPFLPSVRQEASGKIFASEAHRKVVYYLGRLDTQMLDNVGHGTHVCGTIVGLPYNAPSDVSDPAVGMAPGAKVGFIDLSATGQNDVGVPDDLDKDYFPLAYQRGVRIHSDSWGSSVAIYDESAASADKFLFEHPDFLSIFAAGNYGTNQDLPTTVTSPATAKNGIAVGATMSWRRSYTRKLAAPVVNARVEIMQAAGLPGNTDTLTLNWRIVTADWAPAFDRLFNQRLQVFHAADGGAACTPGSTDAARGGVLVALRSAGCNLATKAQLAGTGGASALLLATRQETGYSVIQRDGSPDTLPIGSMPLSMAQQLRQFAASNNTVYITFSQHEVCNCPSYEDIASYSSFGPTADRRIKPDIVAPGDVSSAFSDGKAEGAADQCRTMRKQGTSMAAPVVAGNAALARQYFMAGFYPGGTRNSGPAYTPSGVLLKATLLGGASDMIGYTELSLPLEPAPSFRQGFGRLNLTRALPVTTIAPTGWRMQFVDLAALSEGESHKYCITVTGPTTVTLAWYDYPASPAAGVTLQNDLDLVVTPMTARNLQLRGNGWHDNLNTVERVGNIPNGPASIEITGSRIIAKAGAQRYALVVQGYFTGVLASSDGKNPDPAAKTAARECAAVAAAPPPAETPIVVAGLVATNSLNSAPAGAAAAPAAAAPPIAPAAAAAPPANAVPPNASVPPTAPPTERAAGPAGALALGSAGQATPVNLAQGSPNPSSPAASEPMLSTLLADMGARGGSPQPGGAAVPPVNAAAVPPANAAVVPPAAGAVVPPAVAPNAVPANARIAAGVVPTTIAGNPLPTATSPAATAPAGPLSDTLVGALTAGQPAPAAGQPAPAAIQPAPETRRRGLTEQFTALPHALLRAMQSAVAPLQKQQLEQQQEGMEAAPGTSVGERAAEAIHGAVDDFIDTAHAVCTRVSHNMTRMAGGPITALQVAAAAAVAAVVGAAFVLSRRRIADARSALYEELPRRSKALLTPLTPAPSAATGSERSVAGRSRSGAAPSNGGSRSLTPASSGRPGSFSSGGSGEQPPIEPAPSTLGPLPVLLPPSTLDDAWGRISHAGCSEGGSRSAPLHGCTPFWTVQAPAEAAAAAVIDSIPSGAHLMHVFSSSVIDSSHQWQALNAAAAAGTSTPAWHSHHQRRASDGDKLPSNVQLDVLASGLHLQGSGLGRHGSQGLMIFDFPDSATLGTLPMALPRSSAGNSSPRHSEREAQQAAPAAPQASAATAGPARQPPKALERLQGLLHSAGSRRQPR